MRPRELTALTRFGLGPRPGEIDRAAADPLTYVRDQCFEGPSALIQDARLPDRETLRRRFRELQGGVAMANRAVRTEPGEENEAEKRMAQLARRDFARDLRIAEVGARYQHGVGTANPFVERLVLFWSNHFAINVRQGARLQFTAGLFEREAIRPNVLGYFSDMLAASTTHPAMLAYLDNLRSIGPNSRYGLRSGGRASINENLAREVLELHTLGVDGGYTQDDVEALAYTLTGWTGGFHPVRDDPVFLKNWHEPGPRTILGQTYYEEGAAQLEAVLFDLATHPSTARNIGTELARHFVGDEAPKALIERLTDAFMVSGGDLREVTLALVDSEDAWIGDVRKTVPPYDFMVACGRALDATEIPDRLVFRSARDLAQETWAPPSPAGWPDDDGAFLGGDSLLERVDFAQQMAVRFGRVPDVIEHARRLFGATLDPYVEEAMSRAESKEQGLVLLLMSPALQRR